MNLRVLGCSGGSAPGRSPTSFLVDDVIAIDAGAITSALDGDEQRRVEHVVLSHAHLDHVATLPFLLDNRFGAPGPALHVHGHARTLADLESGVFNRRIWPDLDSLRGSKAVAVETHEITPGRPFRVGHLEVVANEMTHPVPCLGLLLKRPGCELYVAGDTGSAAEVKAAVHDRPDVRAVVIEISWPDRLSDLAVVAGHLTPSMLAAALPLHPTAKVLVTHIKPMFREEVVAELHARGLPVEVLEDGQRLAFR